VASPIAVTGVGVVSPFGASVDAFRDALVEQRTAIAPVPAFVDAGCRSRLAARISGFDPTAWIPPMKLRRMDATGPLALVVAQQALAHASYALTPGGDERVGVLLGTYSAGGHATCEYLTALFSGGPSNAPALLFNSTVGNAAAGLVGLELTLRGPNATVSHKEASGLAAIVAAVDVLRLERADAMVAGGIDAIFDLFFKAHDRFNVMSDAASADDTVAPFSASRRGFVMGEGGFGLWLERADAARDRGAPIRAEILGVGAASAAVPLNAWPDRPEPLVHTMQMALDDAELSPGDVHVVYASANATRGLDEIEARALAELFASTGVCVTSIKGAIGESGASGAAACVAALLCGAAGRVPGIPGLTRVDPVAETLDVVTTTRESPGPIVLVNSFASGGALYTVVLGARP
jgi:3-oxoacyl-[acyl-carrier-protein] synthase II